MDKEIEDLLSSLNIRIDPVQASKQEARVAPPAQASTQVKVVPEIVQKTKSSPFSLLSFVLFFILALAAGFSAAYCNSYFFNKKKPKVVRAVDTPQYSLMSFFGKDPHTRYSESLFSTASSVSAPSREEEPLVCFDSSFFFAPPLLEEEALISQMKDMQRVLGQKKRGLCSLLDQTGPFTERENLRYLSRLSDEYFRLQLTSSSFFEDKIGSQKELSSSEPLRLHATLFGGLPLQGCKEVVQSSVRLQKEIESLFVSLQQNLSLHEKACQAVAIARVIERVASDRLLSLLIDVKELKKRLDGTVQKILTSFEGKIQSFEEMRGICLLECLVSKKAIEDWKTFETKLVRFPTHMTIDSSNQLEGDAPSSMSKIVWSCILDQFYDQERESNDDTRADRCL